MKKGLLLLVLGSLVFVTAFSQTITRLAPVADVYARNGSYNTRNYGSKPVLAVKGTDSKSYARISYLKFSLSGIAGTITSAKLRLYGRNAESHAAIAVSVYSANTDAWTEKSLTYKNRPGHASMALSVVKIKKEAKYYEWDVTAFVKGQYNGDKIVSVVMKDASNKDKLLAFNSREEGDNKPQLVVSTTASPTNQAPVLATINNKSGTVGQALNFTATANDPDANQTKTFSLVNSQPNNTPPPAGALITAAGAFSWTPNVAGSFPITVRVTDNGSPVKSNEQTFTVTVNDPPPTNQAPVLNAIGDKTIGVGQSLTFTASATDPDAGQTKTFSLIGAPGSAAINATSGAFNWTPPSAGSFPFKVRVTDNGSPVMYDEESITVTVSGATTTTTFSNTQTNVIPNPGTLNVPITVSGLSGQINTTSYGLQSVSVQITHPADKELTLQLKSPDGKMIYLFRKSPGVNINTTFSATADKFIDNNEIASYGGSFTSGYRPRQDLALLNNGQNPNGTWNLVVKDDDAASTAGQVTNVSLVFGPDPAKPLLVSSTLPIIKIYTSNGVDIVDDPKVLADMYIINNGAGQINNANQTTYEYQGKIGIEIRGNSTATHATVPKKQYGFETLDATGTDNIDVPLMGMPAKDDWILSAVLSDKSLMRNVLTYQLARDMGYYASRTKFCEVMINDEYRGVFIFQEKIKRDKNRVNVEKLETTDVTEPNVTGGYIFSVDDIDPGDITWKTKYPPEPGNPYKIVYPKAEDWVSAQQTYLKNYVWAFEDALHGTGFQDAANGFRKYIDDKSFMDYFIISEFAKNNDSYRYSTYYNKKRSGKIVAGPVWDFDRAYRNEAVCNSASPAGYIYTGTNNCDGRVVPWWWARLLEDTKYKSDMICRYNTLRQSTLSLARLYSIIDSAAAVLNTGAQQRNFTRWNIWGKFVERIPAPYTTSYAMEIDTLKNWIKKRLEWLDNDMGTCNTNLITRNQAGNLTEVETDKKAVSAVYPSPFKDQMSVTINASKAQRSLIQLADVSGKVLYQKICFLQKGSQMIQVNLNATQLAGGLYLLHIKGSNINVVKKVFKE